MKDIDQVSQQKEADLARIRHEIESLRMVASLLSDELNSRDPYEVLKQKEADLTRVHNEVESLRIVAPLLCDELAPHEQKSANPGEETVRREHAAEATGTHDLFSEVNAGPRRKLWGILSRKS